MRYTPPEIVRRRAAGRRRERAGDKGHRGQRQANNRARAERRIERQTGSRRLARAVRLVWEALPDPDRRVLLRHWTYTIGDGWTFYPRIRSVPMLMADGEPALATCEDEGRTLCFRTSLIEGALPVEALMVLVRHELVHCLQHALGVPLDEREAAEDEGTWEPGWTAIVERVLSGRLV